MTEAAEGGRVSSPARGGGRGRGRGGRGGDRGRGGRGADRGRGGRGRGGGGRGFGRGRGGRGGFRGRGGHKPRTGKRASDDSHEEGGADGAPPRQVARKEGKTNSEFAMLHAALTDAEHIAGHIREHHGSTLRETKHLNSFLQAISNRAEDLYDGLFIRYKGEVVLLLERLYSTCSVGKATLYPPGHEFIIRCEQHGVRKQEWVDDMRPVDGTEPALLRPRDLLLKLIAIDPLGRQQRKIELASTVDDLQTCSKSLHHLLESNWTERSTEATDIPYATQCQLLSKLVSKARRLADGSKGSRTDSTPATNTADTEAGDDGDEEDITAAPSNDVNEEEKEEAVAAKEDTPAAVQTPPHYACEDFTEEEKSAFRDVVARVVEIAEVVQRSRPHGVTEQPFARLGRFATWCTEHELARAAEVEAIRALEAKADTLLLAQAEQLEVVIRVKAIEAGDGAALKAVVDDLWAAGEKKCLTPHSADVLSCVAVAASHAGIAAEVKDLVADRLVETQLNALGEGHALPRRALRFVHDLRSQKRREANDDAVRQMVQGS